MNRWRAFGLYVLGIAAVSFIACVVTWLRFVGGLILGCLIEFARTAMDRLDAIQGRKA